MNVGCRLTLNDEASAQFKELTGKQATRLNVKIWAIKTLSETLGIEIETNFSAAQKKKMKKEMSKDTRMVKVKSSKEFHVESSETMKGSKKTVPTILQRPKDEAPARKKFTLRKK